MKLKANIELCEMSDKDVSGRVRIRMTALKIHNNDEDYNGNGITWKKDYVEDNIESMIGASYKVSFLDTDKTIPSGHGTMEFDENGEVVFKDSETVGSVQKAYIDNIEINGEEIEALVTEGYLYNQSYPNFIEWLRDETNSGTVYGSVEINGKAKAKKIVYADGGVNEDGTPKIGRQPKTFDFTSVAILSSMTPPADQASQVIEINSKEGEGLKKVKSSETVELNELSYDEIATLITRAFNKALLLDEYGYKYWIYKLYPTSNRVVFINDYVTPVKYYLTTYEIKNNSVILGDVSEVNVDWKPVDNEKDVEINSSLIKNILNNEKGDNSNMGDKKDNVQASVVELNSQLNNQAIEINNLNKTIGEKDIEINSLREKETELNGVIVEANKTIELQKTQIAELNEEIEPLRELKATKEKEDKQVEVNSYFKKIKEENGFTETELNSLEKDYVEKCDLEGLKAAETNLCVKKVKEINKTNVQAEVNSFKESNDGNLYFSTKVETNNLDDTDDGSELFK